ncbi:MAG: transketolase [Acidimicrobiales bacterium]
MSDTAERTDLEQLGINVIRGLAMDAPQAANSGHPGTAMALAPLAHVLWTEIMRHDPSHPDWPDRDRFILSAGHACILQYSMLYLTGYGLELDDIRRFRQWGSKTPGHPEVHHTKGIEVTTGPLGQGFANGVGMGIAERYLRNRFSAEICDHHTFVVCGDGDLEEGISHESASLAGHLGLGRLVYVYDDNHITIDGPTEFALNDDAGKRFEAYGWHVEHLGEVANDTGALAAGLRRAMAVEDRPSLLILRSHIGYPSPKFTDSEKAHGNPLGADEIKITKELLGLPPDQSFWVPGEVLELYRQCIPRGQVHRVEWEQRLSAWTGANAAGRSEWDACLAGRGLPGWEAKLPSWKPGDDDLATRQAMAKSLNAVFESVPGLVAGGADLTENTGMQVTSTPAQSRTEPAGRQLHYGIREHAMGGLMNGMAGHGGVLPVGGTFLVFSDYMRGSVRLAALSRSKVIFSWTHDSVGLGEDGPTHQPIEHIASLRAMPQLRVIRPADANETARALQIAIESDGPTAMILSRQKLPILDGTADGALDRGAYTLVDTEGRPEVILVGTGGEVHLCVDAAALLSTEGVSTRVVSFPCWDLFALQEAAYQASVFPPGVPRLAVEAGTSFGWDRWAEASVSIDHFGASAPGATVLEEFGYTAANVAAAARALLTRG